MGNSVCRHVTFKVSRSVDQQFHHELLQLPRPAPTENSFTYAVTQVSFSFFLFFSWLGRHTVVFDGLKMACFLPSQPILSALSLNPALQSQLKLPAVLLQTCSHPALFRLHSLKSKKLRDKLVSKVEDQMRLLIARVNRLSLMRLKKFMKMHRTFIRAPHS